MRRLAAGLVTIAIWSIVGSAPAYAVNERKVTISPSTVKVLKNFDVSVDCGAQSTSAVLDASALGGGASGSQIQMESEGRGRFGITLTAGTRTGPIGLDVKCSDGTTGTGTVNVAPKGGADTGFGGTAAGGGVDGGTMLVGGGLIAVAAAGGYLLFRTRRPHGPGATT